MSINYAFEQMPRLGKSSFGSHLPRFRERTSRSHFQKREVQKQLEEDIKTFAQVFERKMRESIFVIIAKTVVGDRVIACFGDKYTIDEMFDLKAKLPQKYYTATMDEYKISQSEVYNNKLYNKIKELIFKKKSK